MGSDQATMTAGVVAYQGVLAALWRRSRTGRGDAVAVSSLGALHTIKGMHWTCLSNPDQWPGLHLTVWTDPPQHGYSTADLPVLFSLNRRLGAPNDEKTITGLVVRLGGEGLPEGMSLAAGYGDPANPTSPQWKTFWSGLFKRYGWRELAGIFEEFGGELVPFLDYPGLDAHPQIEAMAPFVPMAANGDAVRAVRVPWRLGAYPDGFTYRIAEEAAPVRSKQ
jgi:crotonobetainyl-CoA:carnitine CoA-transferase CaiB-like acyl-CoA transferase